MVVMGEGGRVNQQRPREGSVPELMVLAVNAPTVTTLLSLVLVHSHASR